jgi:hypothetical protein
MMVRREARSKGCELVYARPRRPTDGQEAVTGNKRGDLGGVHRGRARWVIEHKAGRRRSE